LHFHAHDAHSPQAYLHRLLFIYTDVIKASPQLAAACATLSVNEREASHHLRELIHENLCILRFLGKLQQL
jgi:hypothetical protein